jgi:DUF438 domain-containing protein
MSEKLIQSLIENYGINSSSDVIKKILAADARREAAIEKALEELHKRMKKDKLSKAARKILDKKA